MRDSKNFTLDGLAEKTGLSISYLSRLEKGGRNLSLKNMNLISNALGVAPSELLPNNPVKIKLVPVVGFVGAGAETHFYSNSDNPDEETEAAPGSNDKTVAVEIRGTSLGPMFDRALVFYDEKRDPPTSDMLRKLCVVGLVDGRVLVKQLLNGSIVGRFHLLSQTEGMIENAEIEWAAIVKAIVPR